DDLEGVNSLEGTVAGLENGTHAALAETFEQHIRAEQQLVALALQELVDLKGCQPAALHEVPGQAAWIGILQSCTLLHLGRLQQPELADGVHKAGGGRDRHESPRTNRARLGRSIGASEPQRSYCPANTQATLRYTIRQGARNLSRK